MTGSMTTTVFAAVIVDSSALLAIILKEPEAIASATAILRARSAQMSAASYVEVAVKLDSFENGLDPELDETIEVLSIEVVPFALEQAAAARLAAVRFGRKRPARLNFGDCLAYALAKTRNEPLLFKGDDFGKTDLDVIRLDEPRT